MDWNRLRIFQTVAEHGSFTRAGDILELSQSAVSRQIAALEKSLGAVLFHRHSRGLLLTEQGEALYRTVREVSAKLAMTEAQIADSRDRPSGPLKITTTVAFASVWLTPRIRTFNSLYPEIKITLLTSDDLLDLSMREADVAIRMVEPTEPDLVRRHLMTVHSHIYAAPDYLARFGPIETMDDPRPPASDHLWPGAAHRHYQPRLADRDFGRSGCRRPHRFGGEQRILHARSGGERPRDRGTA